MVCSIILSFDVMIEITQDKTKGQFNNKLLEKIYLDWGGDATDLEKSFFSYGN